MAPPLMTGQANVLIVDDRPDKLLVLETLLEPLGQNLVAVRSGEEALKELLDQEFAVALLDVNMPGMDGLETAALIRGRRKTAHIPVIFITAFADELHAARGYSLGAVDYILSPIVPDVLRTKVRVFVDLFLMTKQIEIQAEERVALAREQAARSAAEENARRLEEADSRKSEFIAMLSHELRNPMSAIFHASQVLIDDGGDAARAADAAGIIHRQSRLLNRLMDDLINVSRITRGKIELVVSAFDIAQAVDAAIETHRAAIEARQQRLQLTVPDPPVTIRGDFTRVVQIVANLVHNASKYTERDGQIAVSVTGEEGAAVIRVSDSGVGIPKDRLTDIFEPFLQLPDSHGRQRGGLGVGLALARRLTELHGGSLLARSAGPNRGSEFVVRLPVSVAARAAADRHAEFVS